MSSSYNTEEHIKKAVQTELLGRLPKKKDYYKAVDMERETCRIDGFNQALSEVEQVIKGGK